MKASTVIAAAAALALAATPLCCWAQQTVTPVPPPPPLPSTLPQAQAYATCVMNCDTTAGLCHGTCSVNNSPSLTFAPPQTLGSPAASPTVPAGFLAQCNLSCSSQQLSCKGACTPPF